MAKNPSTRFYFNDWMTDTGLRACSVPARGLWIDCLAICAAARRPGYLEIDGKPCTLGDLARVTGAVKSNIRRWLAELESHGVFSRDPEGAIFNRRMVREQLLTESTIPKEWTVNSLTFNGKAGGKLDTHTSYKDIYVNGRAKQGVGRAFENLKIGARAASKCERRQRFG